jgi:hypothetical protein
MSNGTPPAWESWAPPLDPPTAGGVPYDVAAEMAAEHWDSEPHLCAALQWEFYAAMQSPTPSVMSVSTGVQSIAYQPPAPTGEYGLAIARAQWHRSFIGSYLESVPLYTDLPHHGMPSLVEVAEWRDAWLPW